MEKHIDLINDRVNMQPIQIPSYRTTHAYQKNTLRKFCMTTHAGIGDQVCAEPTLRFALKCRAMGELDKVALFSRVPELFLHLDFDEVFKEKPNFDEWFQFKTVSDEGALECEFISHGMTNCVDSASIFAFRMQLPTQDREIQLTSRPPTDREIEIIFKQEKIVVIHPGKHWESKTFPKYWWDKIIDLLISMGQVPVLIGANTGLQSYVDVDSRGCIDLRDRTDLQQLAWICQRATVLLTNDSSPLHMAASTDPHDYKGTGNAHIGLFATCKHPDFITHFRKGSWQWRETNLSLGGVWNEAKFLPNKTTDTRVDKIDQKTLMSWLPEPQFVAQWVQEKLNGNERNY